MKKIMMMLTALLTVTEINSCNLCWDYPSGGPRLRQIPIERIDYCTCECWKYTKTKGDNNFYICTECSHRLTPEEVLIPKSQKAKRYEFKRWNEAYKN